MESVSTFRTPTPTIPAIDSTRKPGRSVKHRNVVAYTVRLHPGNTRGESTECVSYTVKFSKRLDSTLRFCASSSYLRSRIRTYSGRPRRWLASIAYGRPVYRYSDDLRCCMRIELRFAATTTHIYFAYSVFEQASFINLYFTILGFKKVKKIQDLAAVDTHQTFICPSEFVLTYLS